MKFFVLASGLSLIMATSAQSQDVSGCSTSNAKRGESWERACAAAIRLERDPARKAELHFRRAYVLNERQAYQMALADLNAACTIIPHHATYLHERAYTLNSLGRYQEALVDLNEEASLESQSSLVYQERALTRTRLGDWEGAYADRDRDSKLHPDSPTALIARARARLWLGQFDQARQDLKAAAALRTDSSSAEETRELEHVSALVDAWTHHSSDVDAAAKCSRANNNDDYSQTTLIGDCTLAFLRAEASKDKADALTHRAVAWLVSRQSQHDATGDYEAAVALDPANPDRHTNLGFAYIQEAHSWAAVQEFDRSIAIRRTYTALAGRAEAQYNLGDKKLAFRAAKESFEIQPNELALWVLGDLAKDRGDDASAKLYWMGVYHLGSRDERLMESLRSVGVTDPAAEPGVSSQR